MLLQNTQPIDQDPLVLRDVPKPSMTSDHILIKVNVCGVCRTDLHMVEGELPMIKCPVIPGHEIVGTVTKVGNTAKRFAIGDRVGIAWLHETCGACEFCAKDHENLCDHPKFTGWSVNGGYAEFVTVPETFAYPIPGVFEDEQAAPLLCAGIIGYRALRTTGIMPGQRLGFYGFGSAAHIAIQVARYWKCKVYVFTRNQSNRTLAQQLGATWIGGPEDVPPLKLHASIIFAPVGSLVLRALEALEKGGTLVLAGIHMSPIPSLDYFKHLYYEKVIRSVTNATRRDGNEFLVLASQIPIHTKTTSFPFEQANQALQALKSSRYSGSLVLTV